jgi:hypothetical protein
MLKSVWVWFRANTSVVIDLKRETTVAATELVTQPGPMRYAPFYQRLGRELSPRYMGCKVSFNRFCVRAPIETFRYRH